MKTQSSLLSRLAIFAIAGLTLTAASFAGPDPMYTMVDGKMYVLQPLKKDATGHNGCMICTNGSVTMKGKKPKMLKNGEVVTSEGAMVPYAKQSHGG